MLNFNFFFLKKNCKQSHCFRWVKKIGGNATCTWKARANRYTITVTMIGAGSWGSTSAQPTSLYASDLRNLVPLWSISLPYVGCKILSYRITLYAFGLISVFQQCLSYLAIIACLSSYAYNFNCSTKAILVGSFIPFGSHNI